MRMKDDEQEEDLEWRKNIEERQEMTTNETIWKGEFEGKRWVKRPRGEEGWTK